MDLQLLGLQIRKSLSSLNQFVLKLMKFWSGKEIIRKTFQRTPSVPPQKGDVLLRNVDYCRGAA